MEYLNHDRERFFEAINLAVFNTGLDAEVIEKDYYVTMVLKQLAEMFKFVVFKGGTSLSKCHKVIARFSEDIDITIDNALSQGQKKKLKEGIQTIAANLRMKIPNIEETRSRRDYNRYELAYDSVFEHMAGVVQSAVVMETSFAEISFPTVELPVHSYIGDLFAMEAPDALEQYGLAPFEMKVQGIDRTLIDKVFAVCDYYLQNKVKRHSRHLYDIYKLMSVVPQNEDFKRLVGEVRAVRAKTNICPSAQPGVDVPQLLKKIISEDIYKEDYNVLTVRLLEEKISYETTIEALSKIIDSGMFNSEELAAKLLV